MRTLTPALTALAFAIMAAPALAQIPKTPDGKPDLNGFWSNASLTPLARSPNVKSLVVDDAEARRMADASSMAGVTEEGFKGATYSDPTKGAPPKGGKDFGVQAYDSFWMDPGHRLAIVKGEWRTSNIVEPASGQIPFLDPAGQAKRRVLNRERYETGNAAYHGPEETTLSERCLIGFGQTGGPGMMSVLYNNNYQMVQTPDYMMILVEMAHDARVVPIFDSAAKARASHKPSTITPWLGDTVGWWEGDTFVMETINVRPLQAGEQSFPVSANGVVTEKLTRVGPEEIFYQFEVNDPETYTQDWKAELSFYPTTQLYEYACHEGNYGMHGILAGAREKERQAAEAAAKTKPTKAKAVKGGE